MATDRLAQIQEFLVLAEQAEKTGDLTAALNFYKEASLIDPLNIAAKRGIQNLEAKLAVVPVSSSQRRASSPQQQTSTPQQGTASTVRASNFTRTITHAPARVQNSIARAIGNASDKVFGAAESLDKIAGAWDKDTAAYAKSFLPALDNINKVFGSANKGLADVDASINKFYANVLTTVRKETSGFSSHLPSIIAGLDGFVRDPLNPKNLSSMATAILNSVSPNSAGKINQSIQNMHLDKLAKAPGLLFSSVQKFAKSVDNILSIPVAFASIIYFGTIGLIQQIGNKLNDWIQDFQKFIFDFLDAALGGQLEEIMQLLDDIGTLAGQIQGIAGIFGGANIVSGYALQVNNFTTQINSALSNPLDTVIGYLPTDITQGFSQIMYDLQNPQNVINQLLPPELSQIFAKLSQITGYGFNGNMGYNFASILQGMQGGVINGILTNFAAQYSILGPLIAGGNYQPPISYTPRTDNGYIQGKRYSWNPNTNVYEVK